MNICVYGAASNRIDPSFLRATEELGREIGRRGYGLVFGGGDSGVMGAAARGVFSENGTIIGVAPRFFNVDGVLFPNCTEMIYTDTMRERKQILEDRSAAFIIGPGGIGTMDEFFEILTLRHLEQHPKPIAIFNVNGYYDHLEAFLKFGVEQNFIAEDALMYRMCNTPKELLDYFEEEFAKAEK